MALTTNPQNDPAASCGLGSAILVMKKCDIDCIWNLDWNQLTSAAWKFYHFKTKY
jgi:hypothetical protein